MPIRDAQTWEEAGLENPFSPLADVQSQTEMESEQGGGVPITPQLDAPSDEDVEILQVRKGLTTCSRCSSLWRTSQGTANGVMT